LKRNSKSAIGASEIQHAIIKGRSRSNPSTDCVTKMRNVGAMAGNAARSLLPPKLARHLIGYGNYIAGEPELRLISDFCDAERIAVDVGAHYGAYTYWLQRYAQTIAIEPLPDCANFIRTAFPNVRIYEVALSDVNGEGQMDLECDDGRKMMTEAKLSFGAISATSIHVDVRRLDDLAVHGVGFIKIDAEGHELAILRGALRILNEDRPVLLIECEERHQKGALKSVLALLGPLGYKLSCLTSSGLRGMADEATAYTEAITSNFLFVHSSDSARVLKAGLQIN